MDVKLSLKIIRKSTLCPHFDVQTIEKPCTFGIAFEHFFEIIIL